MIIILINIISDSGLVILLRLLFLADTFLQHFLQTFSQVFLQHFCGGIFITNFIFGGNDNSFCLFVQKRCRRGKRSEKDQEHYAPVLTLLAVENLS